MLYSEMVNIPLSKRPRASHDRVMSGYSRPKRLDLSLCTCAKIARDVISKGIDMKKAAAILAFVVGISGFGSVGAQTDPAGGPVSTTGLIQCGPFLVTPWVCGLLVAAGVVVIAAAASSGGGSGSSGTN